jgi:sugar O-acyltransferase (sialic acid O-acetyltransferase NeuD family)
MAVYGAGGHAKSVLGVLEAQAEWRVVAVLDDDPRLWGSSILGHEVIGGREQIPKLRNLGVDRVHVAIGNNARRGALADELRAAGLGLASVVHSSAFIMKNARIADGAFIHAYAVVGADCRIGEAAIVSAATSIGHDSVLGRCAHLAPGVRIGGGVRIGEFSFVGMGAVVIPLVSVGRSVTVAANSTVTRDLEDGAVAAGMPARVVRHAAGGKSAEASGAGDRSLGTELTPEG